MAQPALISFNPINSLPSINFSINSHFASSPLMFDCCWCWLIHINSLEVGYGLFANSSQSTPIEQTNKEENKLINQQKKSLLGCLSLLSASCWFVCWRARRLQRKRSEELLWSGMLTLQEGPPAHNPQRKRIDQPTRQRATRENNQLFHFIP